MLELRRVSKNYPAPVGEEPLAILHEVSLRADSGESLAIVGPSGCGKSTLLNIIGTLDQPDSGEVLLEGRDLAKLDDTARAAVRNREIGFIFQLHHLLPQCSILENVLLPTLANGNSTGGDAEDRARELLKWVGLESRFSHRPGQLSGGERQRAAVVRALINRPRLILADEPTGSLDRAAADRLAELLLELNAREKVTLVLVTHAPDFAARMQRTYELRDGSLAPPR